MSNAAAEIPVGAIETEEHARQLPEQRDLIAGVRSQPAEHLPGMLCDPNSGWPMQVRRRASLVEVEHAIATADDVHRRGEWAGLGAAERATWLSKLADGIEARAARIAFAESINMGAVITTTKLSAGALGAAVRDAIAHAKADEKPVGPTAVIAPWNAPTSATAGKIATALAAGCPVILKPSIWAPSSPNLFADAIEAAGFPAGVFQLVHGDGWTSRALVADARLRAVDFTGAPDTGRSVAAAAAANGAQVRLELGSNNPVIIRADADVDEVAEALAAGIVRHNGQRRHSPGRVFVSAPLHDALREKLAARLRHVEVGSSLDESSEMGPIAYEEHRNRLLDAIDRFRQLGGRVRSTAIVPPDLGGWFFSPTIITGVSPEAAQAELFGPILTLHPVDSDAEAVSIANGPGSARAGYVFGADAEGAAAVGARMTVRELFVNKA